MQVWSGVKSKNLEENLKEALKKVLGIAAWKKTNMDESWRNGNA